MKPQHSLLSFYSSVTNHCRDDGMPYVHMF